MLDLQLSEMDKSEMIRIIRIMQHIPVVVISEHLESAEVIALYHIGMDSQMCLALRCPQMIPKSNGSYITAHVRSKNRFTAEKDLRFLGQKGIVDERKSVCCR